MSAPNAGRSIVNMGIVVLLMLTIVGIAASVYEMVTFTIATAK